MTNGEDCRRTLPMRAGVAALFETYREIAQAANEAGLDGWIFDDVTTIFDYNKAPLLMINFKKPEKPA